MEEIKEEIRKHPLTRQNIIDLIAFLVNRVRETNKELNNE